MVQLRIDNNNVGIQNCYHTIQFTDGFSESIVGTKTWKLFKFQILKKTLFKFQIVFTDICKLYDKNHKKIFWFLILKIFASH